MSQNKWSNKKKYLGVATILILVAFVVGFFVAKQLSKSENQEAAVLRSNVMKKGKTPVQSLYVYNCYSGTTYAGTYSSTTNEGPSVHLNIDGGVDCYLINV